jgi:hypothetical protein
VAPDSWAIEWVTMDSAARAELAARCGIDREQLPDVVTWATERFGHGFAWSHVFLEAATAREFARRFLPDGFRLLQAALPESVVASFLSMAAPPAQEPGYAPAGTTGVYEALLKRAEVHPFLERRGFEVLGYDRHGGGFHSFRCFPFEKDFADLGASFNQFGLIVDEDAALRCAAFADRPDQKSCADAWHSWLIVEHEL